MLLALFTNNLHKNLHSFLFSQKPDIPYTYGKPTQLKLKTIVYLNRLSTEYCPNNITYDKFQRL